jgi:hypothetical protein
MSDRKRNLQRQQQLLQLSRSRGLLAQQPEPKEAGYSFLKAFNDS